MLAQQLYRGLILGLIFLFSINTWAEQPIKKKPQQVEVIKVIADKKPVKTANKNPVKATNNKSAKAADKNSVKATDNKSVKAADKKPVKITDNKPAKATDINPVKSTDSKPAKAADKNASVQTDKASKKTVTSAVDKNFPGQLTIDVLQKPTPLFAQNKYYLVYELHLTNYQPNPITLTSLTVKGDDQQVFKFTGTALAKMIRAIGVKNPTEDNLTIQAGMSKIIYVWLSFDELKDVPNFLTHEINFKTPTSLRNITPAVATDSLFIEKDLPVVIGTPLRGDNWLAENGPSEASEHRDAHMIIQAHDYFAQRYAIDFIKIDKNGRSFHGNKEKNSSYYAYGKDVISVAPGRVIEVKNDIPDNKPTSGKLAVPINFDTIAGNHVVIAIGGGKYAYYAHLMPDSITVKTGDVVHQGQVIAKVGNSGNSAEPHLHFHIVDKPSFLAANGLPYLFDSFQVWPAKVTKGKNDEIRVKLASKTSQQVVDQLILENTVVKFPD